MTDLKEVDVRLRKLVVLAAVAMIAALLPAMSVQAEPHLPKDDAPHTECDVNGTVAISPGVSATPSNNTYGFVDTILACAQLLPNGYTDVFSVTANGNTTDSAHQGNGEDCAQGGSSKNDDSFVSAARDASLQHGVFHTGFLTATGSLTDADVEGAVHFWRLGTTVIADGPLVDFNESPNRDGYFHAVLEFIPTSGTCELPDDPITQASLNGEAQIWDGMTHDCGDDTKKSDPHC